jgi:hypothetical protein
MNKKDIILDMIEGYIEDRESDLELWKEAECTIADGLDDE